VAFLFCLFCTVILSEAKNLLFASQSTNSRFVIGKCRRDSVIFTNFRGNMAAVRILPVSEHAMNRKTVAYLSLITLVALLGLAAHAQTFSTIYAFNGVGGSTPVAGVTIRAGVLYGTTPCLQGCGSGGFVYQISHVGSNWAYTTIAFLSAQHGQFGPAARPVFGPDNHLYGTTQAGSIEGDVKRKYFTPGGREG
jgi:hypothetical protein